MSPTVHELRNEIRSLSGRFERDVDAQFTKEELAAVADALGADVGDRRPATGEMRAAVRRRTGLADGAEAAGSAFTKPELEAILGALEG